MRYRSLLLTTLFSVLFCLQVSLLSGAEPDSATTGDGTQVQPNDQLELNKIALFEGKNEAIRIKAAIVMLSDTAKPAREMLFDALEQTDSTAARIAVCKALSQSRVSQKQISNKRDFIGPLLSVLTGEDAPLAALAAEALLIFDYKQVSSPLERLVSDQKASVHAKLNVIYALKLQPDKKAILKLFNLLDAPQVEVAAAAEDALISLGIPVAGKDTQMRRQIAQELDRKGKDEFLRDWIIRQDNLIRQLKGELQLWQGRYVEALDERYNAQGDNAAKDTLIAGQLTEPSKRVKLWALGQVEQRRKSTNPRLSQELGNALVNLISDPDRDIRLKTAQLLSLMGEMDSANRLLEQLKTEQDEQVKLSLFVALGSACHYALSPNSEIKISMAVRKQTLKFAEEYLASSNTAHAQKGADVIRKLMAQNGMPELEVDKYLGLFVERYSSKETKVDQGLRGELLGAMAWMCGESVYKTEAARFFRLLFEEALADNADLVREAAVDGLINIDRTKALKTFKKTLLHDNNAAISKKLTELAGEVGSSEDLEWLESKVVTEEGENAWQAMLKIFKRSKADVLGGWINRFDSQNGRAGLTEEMEIAFLELAEGKAISEKNPEMIKSTKLKLANIYENTGRFDDARRYLGLLRTSATEADEKDKFSARLLEVYLKWPNIEFAIALLNNCLLVGDLDQKNGSVIANSIDKYTSGDVGDVEPKVVLEVLRGITIPADRPGWAGQVNVWIERLGSAGQAQIPSLDPNAKSAGG